VKKSAVGSGPRRPPRRVERERPRELPISSQLLSLWGTRVTDAGLRNLGRLERLEFLDLTNTAVTEEGLRQLAGLERLRQVRTGDGKD